MRLPAYSASLKLSWLIDSLADLVLSALRLTGGIVQSVLSRLADILELEKIDFIKCDIEGGEATLFGDDAFFRKFRPKIVIEPHAVNGVITTDKCTEALLRYGYRFESIPQPGIYLPLVACSP
ncbi:FkbM family methyltransferase [Bordetella sp. FB-8]|uniref:FkbM family methyltransferase n=1 Tax=Bordetella sp. FB-8 TaxID=1159870 RepID=UPI00351017DA